MNLQVKNLYRIRVQAKLDSFVSEESFVYVYPTRAALSVNSTVASLGFEGYWPTANYSYHFCRDTIPNSGAKWETEIRKGLAVWQTVTGKLVTVSHTSTDCDTDGDGDVDKDDTTANRIRIVSRSAIEMTCDELAQSANLTVGCADKDWKKDRFGTLTDQITDVEILFSDILTYTWPGSQCTALYQIAIHEGGHAFGFDGDHTIFPALIMYGVPSKKLCHPHGYDIVAIKALYQSRKKQGQ